ncbi:MAG TPA: DUF1698 domain-containing protein [Anaerolineae bacterium]|nr:DUF1698 domain-containing protein [Anaerolineae bacterium]
MTVSEVLTTKAARGESARGLRAFDLNAVFYFLRVALITYVAPVYVRLLVSGFRKYKYCALLVSKYTARFQLSTWQWNANGLVRSGLENYPLSIGELGLEVESLKRLKHQSKDARRVVIGEIDRHGRLLSYFGPLPDFQMVEQDDFQPRRRFAVRLVAVKGCVGIEKSFAGRPANFINEIRVLERLERAGCKVPIILDIDFKRQLLTISYIRGRVLRDELVQRGAQLEGKWGVDGRKAHDRNRVLGWRSGEGKRFLRDVLNTRALEYLFDELRKFHSVRVIGNDIKYGNVILAAHSDEPSWIDFEHAFCYPNVPLPCFHVLCDRDIEKFNLFFGTAHLSYRRLRKAIHAERRRASAWSVPVYFGNGLALGSLWNSDAGFGYWELFLKHHLPPVRGKRILDLYANNAFYSLQMLRRGARHVIALEPSSEKQLQGNLVKAAFEWADNARYSFEYRNLALDELTVENERFDLVTALHAIPVADCATAARFVRHMSTLADIFVLQRGFVMPDGTSLRMEESAQILSENGFPITRIVNGRHKECGLFIGSKQ